MIHSFIPDTPVSLSHSHAVILFQFLLHYPTHHRALLSHKQTTKTLITSHRSDRRHHPSLASPPSITSLTSTVVNSTHRFSGLNFLGFFFRYFPAPLALPPSSLLPPSIAHSLAQIWFYFFAAWGYWFYIFSVAWACGLPISILRLGLWIFVGWLGHGGGWDCGLQWVVDRLVFSFPLQHMDLCGR